VQFLVPLPKAANNLGKRAGLGLFDSMVVGVKAQLAFRRLVKAVRVAGGELHPSLVLAQERDTLFNEAQSIGLTVFLFCSL
jgi:hypothetical protein